MSILLNIVQRRGPPETEIPEGSWALLKNCKSGFNRAFNKLREDGEAFKRKETLSKNGTMVWPLTPTQRPRIMTFKLRGLPPEVRIQIFELEVKRWKWRGRNPPLLAALRPDSVMYDEALEIYYGITSFSISYRNEKKIRWMPSSIKDRVETLEIWFGITLRPDSWHFQVSLGMSHLEFLDCSNVQSLYISSSLDLIGSAWIQLFVQQVKQAVIHLPRLKNLVVEIPYGALFRIIEGQESSLILQHPTRDISEALSVRHQWVRRIRRKRVTVRWDSLPCETLTWTDDHHYRSIPWQRFGLALSFFPAAFSHNVVFWQKINLHFSGLNPKRFMNFCTDRKCPCWRVHPMRISTAALERRRLRLPPFVLFRLERDNHPVRLGSRYCVPVGFFPGLEMALR